MPPTDPETAPAPATCQARHGEELDQEILKLRRMADARKVARDLLAELDGDYPCPYERQEVLVVLVDELDRRRRAIRDDLDTGEPAVTRAVPADVPAELPAAEAAPPARPSGRG